MSSIVVACSTIKDEINYAISKTGVKHPVVWVESGLHENPDALRARLQTEINKISNVDQIILAFGYCGNALLGLYSPSCRLLFPAVDDCISLLLGSLSLRQQLSREMGTYYLTRGWLEYENNICKEYERCLKRYGEQRAARILRIMLEHYKRLVVIDTGAYPLDGCLEKTRRLADTLDLTLQIVPGSTLLLEKLLAGPWEDEFGLLHPGERLSMGHVRWPTNNKGSNFLF